MMLIHLSKKYPDSPTSSVGKLEYQFHEAWRCHFTHPINECSIVSYDDHAGIYRTFDSAEIQVRVDTVRKLIP
jgi:hypothetical protein